MFDPDNQDDGRRSGSLLSVAPGRPGAGSGLPAATVARDVDGNDDPPYGTILPGRAAMPHKARFSASWRSLRRRRNRQAATILRPRPDPSRQRSRSRARDGRWNGPRRPSKGRSADKPASEREPFFTAAHADREEQDGSGRESGRHAEVRDVERDAKPGRAFFDAGTSRDEPDTGDAGYEPWRPLIDPMAVIGGVARSWNLIAFTTILGAAIGVMVALSTPRKYEAFLELLVDPRDVRILDSNLTESGLPSDATIAIVENQTRVLTSGTVLTRVVDKLNLASDPEFNGELDGGLSVRGIISDIRALISGGDADDGAMKHRLAVGNLGKALDVSRSANTFVIVIGAKTRSADKSALIANTVASVFLDTYGKSGGRGRARHQRDRGASGRAAR